MTPERNRQGERERERLQRLQMTSPTLRRQRVYDRQEHIPQPNFAASPSTRPSAPPGLFPPFVMPYNPGQGTLPHQVPRYHPFYGFTHPQHRPAPNNIHPPVPVHAYPNIPRNAIAHHDRQAAYRRQQYQPPVMNHIPQPPAGSSNQVNLQERLQQGYQERHAERLRLRQDQSQAAHSLARELRQQQYEEDNHRHQAALAAQQHRQAVEQQQHPPPPVPAAAIPLARRPYKEPASRFSVGGMNIECRHCHALHFDGEKLAKSTRNNPLFGMCCLQSQVKLPRLPDIPFLTYRELLNGISPLSREFKNNIRQYNAALAFTSLGVKVDSKVTESSGPYCFRVHGELCH